MAQLAVGVLGLSAQVASGGFYAVKHHQRATNTFFNSPLIASDDKLSKINYPVVIYCTLNVGIDREPIKRLNLRGAFKSVALIGDNNSGKTIFLFNTLFVSLFLSSAWSILDWVSIAPTIDAWLKNQLPPLKGMISCL
jgi:hypothetical protein